VFLCPIWLTLSVSREIVVVIMLFLPILPLPPRTLAFRNRALYQIRNPIHQVMELTINILLANKYNEIPVYDRYPASSKLPGIYSTKSKMVLVDLELRG
jgi:hypothetical protein